MADESTTEELMRLALDKGGDAGLAAFNRLIELHEAEQLRAARAAFATSLAAFRAQVPEIAKNASGAHGARYATLDHIVYCVQGPLADNGLALTFDSEELDDGRLRVWAVLHHTGGHVERTQFTVSREAKSNRMNDSQRDGSALSYGRRYALGLALGISTGERDDDGQSLAAPVTYITAEQALELEAAANDVGADHKAFLVWLEAESWETVPRSKLADAKRGLAAKARRAKEASE